MSTGSPVNSSPVNSSPVDTGNGAAEPPPNAAPEGVAGGSSDPKPKNKSLDAYASTAFHNAEDWTAPEQGTLPVHASVHGGTTTIDIPQAVEFIHFGKVHLDNSQRFGGKKLRLLRAKVRDDDAADKEGQGDPGGGNATPEKAADPAPATDSATPSASSDAKPATDDPADVEVDIDEPAHGLMFQAALKREGLLLAGFIRSHVDAITDPSKGVVGVLSAGAKQLMSSDAAEATVLATLNPHVEKIQKTLSTLEATEVTYPLIHASGRELHSIRGEYRAFVTEEIKKRSFDLLETAKSATQPATDKLKNQPWEFVRDDAVPKLTSLVTTDVKDFLATIQKVSAKSFDIYTAVVLDYSLRLEPVIEEASRQLSISSIKNRTVPMFPVWFEGQPFTERLNGILGDANSMVQKAAEQIGSKAKPAQDLLNKMGYEVQVDEVFDFLSRPDRVTPGRPFLDQVFLVPATTQGSALGTEPVASGWAAGLGQGALDSIRNALGLQSLPKFMEWVVPEFSTVTSEFVRSSYRTLIALPDKVMPTEAEFIEAGERHLVGNIADVIMGAMRFLPDIRGAALDSPTSIAMLSFDSLISREKEFSVQNLKKWVQPAVKFAMREMFKTVMKQREKAIKQGSHTMEGHLAQLPSVFAGMFRNTFFPIWDKAFERIIDGLGGSLVPKVETAVTQIAEARVQIEQVRTQTQQALAGLENFPSKLLRRKSEDEPAAATEAGDLAAKEVKKRKQPAVLKVNETQLHEVEPHLKWDQAATKASDSTEATTTATQAEATPGEKNSLGGDEPAVPYAAAAAAATALPFASASQPSYINQAQAARAAAMNMNNLQRPLAPLPKPSTPAPRPYARSATPISSPALPVQNSGLPFSPPPPSVRGNASRIPPSPPSSGSAMGSAMRSQPPKSESEATQVLSGLVSDDTRRLAQGADDAVPSAVAAADSNYNPAAPAAKSSGLPTDGILPFRKRG